MKPFVLITDSGSDLSTAMAEEYGITVVYLGAELEGEPVDTKSLDGLKAFYDGMRAAKATKTFAANAEQFAAIFEKAASEGNDILYLGFSSALSGTYAASLIAKDMVLEKYPDVRIECFDTKGASLGQGLVVYYAAMMKQDGAEIDSILAFLTDFAPKMCHRFTVDDLVYLKRGGRVSSTTALVGTLLSIKPILHVSDEGKLISLRKARGRKAAVQGLFEDMKALAVNPHEHTVFISHADCMDDAKALADMIEKEFSPQKIVIGDIGPVVGAHSGPGTLALFFYASAR
ncbi:MAG: DegV family protein [Clostridia bacterium]|nr:DegV family protein [Clostridia bacterium]